MELILQMTLLGQIALAVWGGGKVVTEDKENIGTLSCPH